MAKSPASGHNTTADNLQTWVLRVYIHCEGCRKKVFKVLQSIDGVLRTVVDAKDHKAIVTGSVNGDILVQKLLKSGKHAEILPQSFAASTGDNTSGNSKKKKQSIKHNDVVASANDAERVNDEKHESKIPTTGNVEEITNVFRDGYGSDGGKQKKKNKKNKGGKNNIITTDRTSVSTGIDTEGLSIIATPAKDAGVSMEPLNQGSPMPQTVYSTPYDLPPYHNNYPTPAYGVSYSTSYPSAESSYYTPPVYGYSQSHPSGFYPLPQPPPSYGRSAFDDDVDEGGEGRGCVVM